MRRVWFALMLALLLPLTGLWVTVRITNICQPIARQLAQAENAEPAEAARLCAAARESWEQNRKFMASVIDHEPMEDVDAAFRALEVYLEYRDAMHICQSCAQLSSQVQAIGESQGVNWWSIF